MYLQISFPFILHILLHLLPFGGRPFSWTLKGNIMMQRNKHFLILLKIEMKGKMKTLKQQLCVQIPANHGNTRWLPQKGVAGNFSSVICELVFKDWDHCREWEPSHSRSDGDFLDLGRWPLTRGCLNRGHALWGHTRHSELHCKYPGI